MASFHCILSSPEGRVFEGKVASVIVPATDGELGILYNHAPMLAMLGCGELRITLAEASPATSHSGAVAAGATVHFFVEGGFVQVLKNRVSLLATAVESLDSLKKSVAEERVQKLVSGRPDSRSPFEERERHEETIRVARRRAKLARA